MTNQYKWLSIPREYVQITTNREQFEAYADAYLKLMYPGWVAVDYKRKRVLCKWEGYKDERD